MPDDGDPFGDFAFWLPPTDPTTDPPTYQSDFAAPMTATHVDGALEATLPLVDALGEPVGDATISAVLAPSGGPLDIDVDQFPLGNHKQLFKTTAQPLTVVGQATVTVPGDLTFALDASSCFAAEQTFRFITTDPRSFVSHGEAKRISCALDNGTRTGSLRVTFSDSTVFVRALLDVPPDGFIRAVGFFDPDSTGIHGDLFARDHLGNPLEEAARLDLEIAPTGEPFDYILQGGTWRFRFTGTAYAVTGTLTFPGNITFDLGHCWLEDVQFWQIQSPETAPAPDGKAPSNDLPSGAELLTVGQQATTQTKSASATPEAPFVCLPDSQGGFLPVTNTVWYRIEGTGDPITVDTAGTGFDSVVAVYTADGAGGYEPVDGGCVDDVPLQPVGRTTQAAVTIDTTAGTTYFVQIGGFPDFPNWGTLRVAVL